MKNNIRKNPGAKTRVPLGALKFNVNTTCYLEKAVEKKRKIKFEKTQKILAHLEAQKKDQAIPASLSACNSLNDLGLFYGTDKSALLHDLCDIYEKFLGKFQNQSINLFEFGCLNMASLNMWGSFFKNAHIFGVDPAQTADSEKLQRNNLNFISHDAYDADYMLKVFRLHQPTIIIDDATHYYSHQIMGFESYFPWLAQGGIYIVEDLQTSFGKFQEGIWNDQEQNPAQYFTGLALAICGEGLPHASMPKVLPAWLDTVESISFVKNAAIICKK